MSDDNPTFDEVVVEVRLSTGETFVLGKHLPVGGLITKISAVGDDVFIYMMNGVIETVVQGKAKTITRVGSEFVNEWLERRQLAVNEEHRIAKSALALEEVSGKRSDDVAETNPR